MPSFDCVVIGDVFFDVIAQKPSWPLSFPRGGTSYLKYASLMPGGAGNVAVGLSNLGAQTAFIGKSGMDNLGAAYRKNLRLNGVFSRIFLDSTLPTGLIVVFTEPAGERSFQVFRGANDNLSASEIEHAKYIIRNSKFLHLSGYSLVSTDQQNAILKAIEIAKQSQIKIIFDPAAFNLIENNVEIFQKMLFSCDVFCPNLKEAIAITQKKSLKKIVEVLKSHRKLTIIKLGNKGSLMVNGNDLIRTPALPVDVSDTTGAGDAFTAAVIYGLTHNLPMNSTLKLANWFAAHVIGSFGARGYPSKKEIDTFKKCI